MKNRSPSACRPILILGVERSGTSLVSELVSRWGGYGGDPALLLPANELNPQGFFEYRPMQDFLIGLHASTGVSEWCPAFKDLVRTRAFEPRYRDPALQLVADMETAGRPWFWKEPYLCLSLSFWEQIWKEPLYIVVFRNPHDSAKSYERFVLPELQKKIRITGYFGLRWQHFILAMLEHVERNPAKLFLRYEQLLRSPVEQCRRLCEFLDRQYNLNDGAEKRSCPWSRPSTRGSGATSRKSPFFDLPEATPEQKGLFRFLETKTTDPLTPFDPGRFPFPAFGLEYLENFGALVDIRHSRGRASSDAVRPRKP